MLITANSYLRGPEEPRSVADRPRMDCRTEPPASAVGEFTERHRQGLLRAAALNRDGQPVTRLMTANDAEHVVVARHALTVDADDHVAPLHLCARGTLARRDLVDVRADLGGEVRLLHQRRGDGLG